MQPTPARVILLENLHDVGRMQALHHTGHVLWTAGWSRYFVKVYMAIPYLLHSTVSFREATHHEIITVIIIIVNNCDGLMLALLFYCQLFFLC